MEFIGVAIIVPNTFWPWGFAHPRLVLLADATVGVLALCLKMGHFDVEPQSAERHALRVGVVRANVHMLLPAPVALGVSLTG